MERSSKLIDFEDESGHGSPISEGPNAHSRAVANATPSPQVPGSNHFSYLNSDSVSTLYQSKSTDASPVAAPVATAGPPAFERYQSYFQLNATPLPLSTKLREDASNTRSVFEELHEDVMSTPQGEAGWAHHRDTPTSQEIRGHEFGHQGPNSLQLEPNNIHGAWPSSEEYLRAMYGLFREDGLAPLRDCVDEVRGYPPMEESESLFKARIYDLVYICGVTVHTKGLAIKLEFSTRRSGKRICWPLSTRLKSGSAVALTPASDAFKTICKIAIVVARPLKDLDLEMPYKPAVHVEFADPTEVEIDPQKEWLMVEAPNSYWEATRHTLTALQKMCDEDFPLSRHILDLHTNVNAPAGQHVHQLRLLSQQAKRQLCEENGHGLDSSQQEALDRMLTKSLALVQGPPGTGKTYVSVVALRLLLAANASKDGPIVVTAHTNHALDQLLRLISPFEPNFVRLGGQSSDQDLIRPRTLPALREKQKKLKQSFRATPLAIQKKVQTVLEKELMPLAKETPLTVDLFQSCGLLTQDQAQSLVEIDHEWEDEFHSSNDPMSKFCMDQITPFKKHGEDTSVMLWEEYDEATELQVEDTALRIGLENDQFEDLHGRYYDIKPGFTSRNKKSSPKTSSLFESFGSNLAKIPESKRGQIYDHLRQQIIDKITTCIREQAESCVRMAKLYKIARWHSDHQILLGTRLIGMTTTGLSKYRPLVKALKPKVVLVEEAAETLEPSVTVAFLPSVEHMILVGDHQQLRGHCNVRALEGNPYYLDVSLFERLVMNHVEFTQLKLQRRMRPEIREIMTPIYPRLKDHPSVENKMNVKGMRTNLCFVNHDFSEASDDQLSKLNPGEALLCVMFCRYLNLNGVSPGSITMLTFYNGQRRLLIRLLAKHRIPECRVATVDSFQGEESDIVILSLVRCNYEHQIGFLSVENRVCVALSRARLGFYIFGHITDLYQRSALWREVCKIMEREGRLYAGLPIVCQAHGVTTWISAGEELQDLDGGCDAPCKESLPCGHKCALKCHPVPHENLHCNEPCSLKLLCGHRCRNLCGDAKHCCPPCDEAEAKRLQQDQLKNLIKLHQIPASDKVAFPAFVQKQSAIRETTGLIHAYHEGKAPTMECSESTQASLSARSHRNSEYGPRSNPLEAVVLEEQLELLAKECVRRRVATTGSGPAALEELRKEMANASLSNAPIPATGSPQRQRRREEWFDPRVVKREMELLETCGAVDCEYSSQST